MILPCTISLSSPYSLLLSPYPPPPVVSLAPQSLTLTPIPTPMSTAEDPPSAVSPVPAPKKPSPGMPWGQAETFHLIDAYEEKWLDLKRSQLKGPEWEDVAAIVAERSGTGGPGQIPAKSGTQCRHKIEKLRKRFKAERARPVRSFWPFFERMARLDRGPTPIAAAAPARHAAAFASTRSSDEDDDEEEEAAVSNSRSVNGLLHSRVAKEEEVEEEKEEVLRGGGGGSGAGGGFVGIMEVVKGFGDEVVRIEKRKIEILREIEKDRMEMEMKRQKMVMETQQYLIKRVLDAVTGSSKKATKFRSSFQ